MESKRVRLITNSKSDKTFNRTSMESKLNFARTHLTITELLIEPVWNRNPSKPRFRVSCSNLLIEPVWNRNVEAAAAPVSRTSTFNRTSMESKLITYANCFFSEFAFNRTSMESKLEFLNFIDSNNRLLIEPVWNRNDRTHHQR